MRGQERQRLDLNLDRRILLSFTSRLNLGFLDLTSVLKIAKVDNHFQRQTA